ncbi:MAG: glycosyltransferase family 2 protein [Pseudomonadota bacterium]
MPDHGPTAKTYRGVTLALIVPCYNEARTIETVIRDFSAAMPELQLHVFDNASSDDTAGVARRAGALVTRVSARGKGNVVRRMFADVDADILVLVDGDATYDAPSVKRLVDKVLDEGLDMVVGCRETRHSDTGVAYRWGHRFGNRLLTQSVARIFGGGFTDMLSGYRAISRRFAKSFPALSRGFEIETELAVHALELRMPYGEVKTPYQSRPEGSVSKLSTYRDGFRILRTIAKLYIAERPLEFYAICSVILAALSVLLAIPLFIEFAETGLVPRFPTAILCAAIMVIALLSLACGLILDNVKRARHEIRRLAYLAIPRPQGGERR